MGIRLAAARGVSALSTWGLKHVFRRPAANFPGKIALYVDPHLIGDLAGNLARGSVVVCGTNGKTTVTNLLADALEAAGMKVVCNRTGANLDSGVATALLHGGRADWGVFESDELWLARILPELKADYVVLLNLFRDQLDRVGEIDRTQESIAGALASSPETVLVYNADDPLCEAIARRCPNRTIPFGIAEDMGLEQNTVADAQMCQVCEGMLVYEYRQYGQLGAYACSACSFARPKLSYEARGVHVGAEGISFLAGAAGAEPVELRTRDTGAYLVYNLLAAFATATLLGCPTEVLQGAIDAFDPQNGRLETFEIGGRHALLNLAKNPTGFNQNLKIVMQDEGPRVVAFFVNDKEGDGRDVSWLWDVDFEELAGAGNVVAFAGGIRKNDLQVRLKYAGVAAECAEGAADVFARTAQLPAGYKYYLIANYTALPGVRAEMVRLAGEGAGAASACGGEGGADRSEVAASGDAAAPEGAEGKEDAR